MKRSDDQKIHATKCRSESSDQTLREMIKIENQREQVEQFFKLIIESK